MMMLAIETQSLTRHYPHGGGVSDLALQVAAGGIHGFLGPNGAGKTTTIRLLLGLLHPQGGEIRLNGVVLERHLHALCGVGAMVEAPSLYQHLSGRENLNITRTLLDLPRSEADRVLGVVGLREDADRLVREYSLGMRQRLGIGQALLGKPKLLILDEPTNGLDPAGMADMRRLLRDFAAQDIAVFISSHLLGEIEQVADRVSVIHRGQLLFQDNIAALRALAQQVLQVDCNDPEGAIALLRSRGLSASLNADGTLSVTGEDFAPAEVNRWLVEAGFAISSLHAPQTSLEDLFLRLTGNTEVAA